MSSEEEYWSNRYKESRTGWDLGQVSNPLKKYFDQLKDKRIKILIPGAGNAYEAAYLWDKGFKNTYILDVSELPLKGFSEKNPTFPKDQMLHGDFFEHIEQYDLIVEQTFFCSFPPYPERRRAYASKMAELLMSSGKLVGLWFDLPLTGDYEKRPFGGSKSEYMSYFEPFFQSVNFSRCYNSMPDRQGIELFGKLEK